MTNISGICEEPAQKLIMKNHLKKTWHSTIFFRKKNWWVFFLILRNLCCAVKFRKKNFSGKNSNCDLSWWLRQLRTTWKKMARIFCRNFSGIDFYQKIMKKCLKNKFQPPKFFWDFFEIFVNIFFSFLVFLKFKFLYQKNGLTFDQKW